MKIEIKNGEFEIAIEFERFDDFIGAINKLGQQSTYETLVRMSQIASDDSEFGFSELVNGAGEAS